MGHPPEPAAALLTASEVVALLRQASPGSRISRSTIHRRAASGELPHVRIIPQGRNGMYLFDRAVVEMFARHGGARDRRRRLEAKAS